MMKNILFNAEMTKAILDGRKNQIRRVIKDKLVQSKDLKFHGNETCLDLDSYNNSNKWFWWTQDGRQNLSQCVISEYKKGDTVWVREPAKIISYGFSDGELYFKFQYNADGIIDIILIPDRFIDSSADYNYDGDMDIPSAQWIKKCQSVPNGCIKEMARIFLKITDVRVERLHDITVEDIIKEGVIVDTQSLEKYCKTDEEFDLSVREAYYLEFEELWDKTAPKGYKWDDNPYIFMYEFKKLKRIEND